MNWCLTYGRVYKFRLRFLFNARERNGKGEAVSCFDNDRQFIRNGLKGTWVKVQDQDEHETVKMHIQARDAKQSSRVIAYNPDLRKLNPRACPWSCTSVVSCHGQVATEGSSLDTKSARRQPENLGKIFDLGW